HTRWPRDWSSDVCSSDLTFATIPSGTYILKVSKEGFSPFTEKQVPVTINSVTRVDVTLKIGSVSQAVEVTAETALLQTDRSEVRDRKSVVEGHRGEEGGR